MGYWMYWESFQPMAFKEKGMFVMIEKFVHCTVRYNCIVMICHLVDLLISYNDYCYNYHLIIIISILTAWCSAASLQCQPSTASSLGGHWSIQLSKAYYYYYHYYYYIIIIITGLCYDNFLISQLDVSQCCLVYNVSCLHPLHVKYYLKPSCLKFS